MKYIEYKLDAIILDDKATEFLPKAEAKTRSKALPDHISDELYRKISPSFYCVSNEGEPKRYGLAIMYVLKIIEAIKRLFGKVFK
jgi:hypothetical protein